MQDIYGTLPKHMREEARQYIENGVPPGSFLLAILAHDFKKALDCADSTNYFQMHKYHEWLFDLPRKTHGSYQTVYDHCRSKATFDVSDVDKIISDDDSFKAMMAGIDQGFIDAQRGGK